MPTAVLQPTPNVPIFDSYGSLVEEIGAWMLIVDGTTVGRVWGSFLAKQWDINGWWGEEVSAALSDRQLARLNSELLRYRVPQQGQVIQFEI